MKEFLARLIQSIAGLFSGKKKSAQPTCSFCGEKGHTEEDCPRAAKFKMFGERDG